MICAVKSLEHFKALHKCYHYCTQHPLCTILISILVWPEWTERSKKASFGSVMAWEARAINQKSHLPCQSLTLHQHVQRLRQTDCRNCLLLNQYIVSWLHGCLLSIEGEMSFKWRVVIRYFSYSITLVWINWFTSKPQCVSDLVSNFLKSPRFLACLLAQILFTWKTYFLFTLLL